MKSKLLVCTLLIALLFSACSVNKNSIETHVVMDTSYGEIKFSNGKYQYTVYGNNKEIIEQGESMRLPNITFINDTLLKFSLQTGTGLSTQWGFYYDTEQGVKSTILTCIYDEFGGNVAYGDDGKIIVRNIFDVNKYYYEVLLSSLPLSDMTEPIFDAKFIDEGKKIKVSYYSGVDFSEKMQEFELPNKQSGDGSMIDNA